MFFKRNIQKQQKKQHDTTNIILKTTCSQISGWIYSKTTTTQLCIFLLLIYSPKIYCKRNELKETKKRTKRIKIYRKFRKKSGKKGRKFLIGMKNKQNTILTLTKTNLNFYEFQVCEICNSVAFFLISGLRNKFFN